MPRRIHGRVVAWTDPVGTGWELLRVAVWALLVGPAVDEEAGAAVDGTAEGLAVVVEPGGSVLVVSGVGRELGWVGLLVTGTG
jgi:hypothetical protein